MTIRLSLRERFAARVMEAHMGGLLQLGIDDEERSRRVKSAAILSVQLGDEMARELTRELVAAKAEIARLQTNEKP